MSDFLLNWNKSIGQSQKYELILIDEMMSTGFVNIDVAMIKPKTNA